MKFHPAAEILTWSVLVAVTQLLTIEALLVAAGPVFIWALLVSVGKFAQLVRRTRWIMLSLLLVYVCTTPGQPLLAIFDDWGPSWEGLSDGVIQLTRLLVVLAGLAILLDRLQRPQLISGIYTLLVPLQWSVVSRERVALRLALTLHYAEAAMLRDRYTFQDGLRSSFESNNEISSPIELTSHRFRIMDGMLLSLALLLLFVVLR